MRGVGAMQKPLFTSVQLERFVLADHPIRSLCELLNAALKCILYLFDVVHAVGEHEAPPSERLPRALFLHMLHSSGNWWSKRTTTSCSAGSWT